MKPNTQKQVKPARSFAVGYARFSEHRTFGATRRNLSPTIKGPLTKRERYHGAITDETKPAVVLSKNQLHGWCQRSACEQGWTVFFPRTPNDFRGSWVATLREALVILAGWLNFTSDETMEVTK
jgi:hypothetical protein